MRKIQRSWVLLPLAALLLAACRGAATETPNPQLTSQAVLTAAAQTAQARMTEIAAATPTSAPATPTLTLEPTQALTVTATALLTPTLQVGGTDKLEFVMDVTVPDGTQYKPGDAFTKTWRLKNAGTSTWNSSYSLVYVSGEQMGAPAAIPLSAETPPGQTADISVNLTAPASAGSYFGFFMLRGPGGNSFGVGPNNDQPFYVQVVVGAPDTSGGTTPAPSGSTVSGVTLAVDNAEVQGACPHVFYFAASFVINKAATVTYKLEAETGFELTLPAPTTAPLDAGKHTVTYTLEFQDDVEGWARFHVTSPEDVQSGQVSFSLECD